MARRPTLMAEILRRGPATNWDTSAYPRQTAGLLGRSEPWGGAREFVGQVMPLSSKPADLLDWRHVDRTSLQALGEHL